MARKLQELFREAKELEDRDRAQLAGMLIETLETQLDPDVEATWAEEVERRVREVDSGKVKTIPWAQVRSELFGRVKDES
jgi:putative addiction module component (TIGR02574 family)